MPIPVLKKAFETSSRILPPLPTEEDAIVNADGVYEFVRSWLEDRDFQAPLVALDLLMLKKKYENGNVIRTRRDGITPDYLHELRIALSVIADYQEDMVPERYIQSSLVAAFIHDLGEDFNILPDRMAKYFARNIKDIKNSPDIENMILRMERMTFDRKYDDAAICKELGVKKKLVPSQQMLSDFMDKIERDSGTVRNHLPPLKMHETRDAKGNLIVSRFIAGDITDWNLYIGAVKEDSQSIYIKMKDRCDGLGTRIGPNFDIAKYGEYLSKSFQTFSIDNQGKRMAEKYPLLRDAFNTTDDMLGALHRIGRIYINVHPSRNIPGTKGYNIETLPVMDFSAYFPGALRSYKHMPDGLNPLNIILTRIRESSTLGDKGKVLYDKIVSSIEETMKPDSQLHSYQVDQFEMKF